jgi:hypothetical protein
LHVDYQRTRREDGIRGISLEFAAYIVTVIERHFDAGDWQRDGSLGKDSFPFHWRGSQIYPVSWCYKRLVDGPGDDVWVKFDTLVIREAKNGASRPRWKFWVK